MLSFCVCLKKRKKLLSVDDSCNVLISTHFVATSFPTFPQACKILLTLGIPAGVDDVTEKGSGYCVLVDALLTLMGVGSDYAHRSKALSERVLLACCAHQCFSLAVNLLGALPPSYHTLIAMVEGKDLSVVVSPALPSPLPCFMVFSFKIPLRLS